MKKLLLLVIIPFALLLANSGVIVTQSNFGQVSLSVSLPPLSITQAQLDGEMFSELSFPEADIPTQIGAPRLPVIRELVEIPFGAEVSVNVDVIKNEYLYPQYKVQPRQAPIPKSGPKPDFVMSQEYYNQDEFVTYRQDEIKSGVRARIEMIGEIRGHRVALVEIYPVAYNSKQNVIEYASEMKVDLIFSGSNLLLTEQMRNNYYSKPYDLMMRGLIANYDGLILNPPPDIPIGYLIIVPDEWVNNIQPLVQWRMRKGYKVFVRTLSQVGGGTNSTVRNYILNAYNTWSVRPTFVLLVGDVDKIGYFVGTGEGNPNTDLNYSLMTTPDYLPDLDVSRASVASSAELDSLIAKTIKYEKNQWINGTDWTKKALFIASADGYWHGVTEGTQRYCQAKVRSYGMIADSIYLYYTSGAPAIITTKINEGRALVTYSGHGDVDQWAEPPYDRTNVHQLSNIDKVPLVGSFCCLSGDFAGTAECFSESWIRSGYRGAIANYASSVTSYWEEDDTLQRRVFDYSFDSSYYWAMGMLNKAKIRFYTQMGNSSTTRRYFEMYNMMGDGAIDVYSDIPAQLVVSYPAVIPLGIYQIPITVTKNGSPVRNALVCAMGKNDTSIQVSAYTNSSGQVVLPVTTSAPDSVYITVTGHNLAPHLGGVVPIPPGPYVMYMRHLILDPAPGGNNDSIINPGEAVEMRVWFRNYGNSTANNVQVWLRTTDSHITITDSFKTIGNIPSNDSGYTANGFHFTVAVSCTNAYNLNFTLAIRDAADSSWRSTLSIPVAQCVLQHESTLVNDPAPGGNNNGIINRGETVNLITTISNIGGANANNVLAILSTNTPHVTITDPTSNFGLITINSSGNNASDPFTVSVDSSITPGSMIQFKVVMTSGVYVDSFQFTLPVEIYMEDFEATNGSYIPNPLTGGWAWGIPSSGPGSAHSGTKCWATVLAGNYKNSANWTLTSPVFTASGNNPQLKFWHWYYMDSSYDGGNVKISTNNGSTWTVVTPVGGYNGTAPSSNAGIPNQPCYMGQSNGWLEATFNLPVTAGQQFLLRWHFGSDASVVYAGWYIDDITGIGFTNILSGISEVSQSINHLTTMLYAPKPNPVINGLARISFSLAEPTRVSLKIYDASGRIVKTLVNGQVVRGIYNLTWDGRDDNHRSVADGIYFYTLETSKQNFTKKMVYTR